LNGQSVEARAEQRLPEIALEAVIEQIDRALAARGDRRFAEDHGHELAAFACGARHYIEA
jgi:hypothetical protein